MRKFWGYYENDTFHVGCSGGTVYICDSQNRELAKFKDFPYAYTAAFMPGRNIIAVKSTAGYLGFYDLDRLTLIRKIRATKLGAQDEGFAFSADGKYFYNIEKPRSNLYTQLGIYETETFAKINTLFPDENDMVLKYLETDTETGICYAMGYMRKPKDGICNRPFIGIFDREHSRITDMRMPDAKTYGYLEAYKSWEMQGCTERALQWNYGLKSLETVTPVSVRETYHSI